MRRRALSKKFLERRMQNAPEGDHNSNWAISYGDMITLLLAFFMIFFSVDKKQEEVSTFETLVEREFASESEPAPVKVWGVPTSKDEGTYAGIKSDSIDQLGVKTEVMGNRLIIEFPDISFFESGSLVITSSGEEALRRFAKVFTKFSGKMRLIVRGYTDNRPVKSKRNRFYSDNLELSSLRAISALRVMEKAGIPFSLMRIGGYGETDKSTKELDSTQLALDRKIVLVIEPLDQTERNNAISDWSRVPANSEDGKQGESQ